MNTFQKKLLALATFTLLALTSAVATVQAFSVADQAVVDKAVERVERVIAVKGEASRAKIVSRLRDLQLKYATDARVRKYMPRIIYFVQNPSATSYPAGAGYVDPIVSVDPDQPMMCTMEYAPVCSASGVTYGNSCMASTSGATIAYTGECVTASSGATASGASASGATSAACERGQITASGACTSAYAPIVITTASTDTPTLGYGTQYVYPFSMRAAVQYTSIKRLVFQINATLGGKSLDSAVYREYGLANEYDNIFQSSADGNSKLSNFAILVNGLNVDGANGVSYRAVKSGTQLYLVVDFERRIILTTTPTNFELKTKISVATANDYLRISIPSLSLSNKTGTPESLKAGVSETSAGSASVVWSPQLSSDHSETSADYFTDWGLAPTADGDVLAPINYLGR
jgi:hypothetical protein